MRLPAFVRSVPFFATLLGVALTGYLTRDSWMRLFLADKSTGPAEPSSDRTVSVEKIILSDQAQENLRLRAKQLKPQPFWRTMSFPGTVTSRPGRNEREIVAPVAGKVMDIAHLVGDTVQPPTELFSLKLMDGSLQQTQTEMFKATQDLKLADAARKRLASLGGAVPESRLIELDSQIIRHQVIIKSVRQELRQRGFPDARIDSAAEGDFIAEVPVVVPDLPTNARVPIYEVKEVKVELGKHVQAGDVLCVLADYRTLDIEGRAFRDEMSWVERSAEWGWPVEVDFGEKHPADRDAASLAVGSLGTPTSGPGAFGSLLLVSLGESKGWFPHSQDFVIRRLAPTIDPTHRTSAFYLHLKNQARIVERDGKKMTLWRYRTGQMVRLQVRVERLDNVYVLPADALVVDGAEAFVFTQNVNTFERNRVRILFQDRENAVIANDGSLIPGAFVVQSAADQLNRMIKAGSGGPPKGYHVHADGSLHKNEDEGK